MILPFPCRRRVPIRSRPWLPPAPYGTLLFSNLEVDDEGGFWETGDRAALEAKMRFLNEKMDELATDLKAEALGNLAGLSAEDIASRIEDFLKERQ